MNSSPLLTNVGSEEGAASSKSTNVTISGRCYYLTLTVAILSSLSFFTLLMIVLFSSKSTNLIGINRIPSSLSQSNSFKMGLSREESKSGGVITSTNVAPNTTEVYVNMNPKNPVHPHYPEDTLPGQTSTSSLVSLLTDLYSIATSNGGNRVITGPGFNATVDYIVRTLETRTKLVNIVKTYFSVGMSELADTPTLSFNNKEYQHTDDFLVSEYSTSTQTNQFWIILVKNHGCSKQDWIDAANQVELITGAGTGGNNNWFGLVSRGTCQLNNKIGYATQYGASGIIISAESSAPSAWKIIAPDVNTITVISVSYPTAEEMISAIDNAPINSIMAHISVKLTQLAATYVTNICADTPRGDPTAVVLVGGHADGVAAGPGINDDGSGSMATLQLAIDISTLLMNDSYVLTNMIKFCWFGAEEQGLLGSTALVRRGISLNNDSSAKLGERQKDWAVMIDLDMLGSMNFVHYIYDANQYVPPSTPVSAIAGSKALTDLFFYFFESNKLPADSDRFDGRSDYGPFLSAGTPAGGVDAGADKTKSIEQRTRYYQLTGYGGMANVILDTCYHRACDTIDNINWAVITNQTQSAAWVTETLAQTKDLRIFLGNPISALEDVESMSELAFEYRFGPI